MGAECQKDDGKGRAMKPYFQDDAVTIYHGCAMEIVPTLGRFDLLLTDPPYGVEFRGEHWDKDIPPYAVEMIGMFPRAAIVMGTVAAWQFPVPKWVACWARPASSSRSCVGGFSHWSPILLYGDCKMSVDFKSWHAIANAYPSGFGHPSPKPECLMRWLVSELSEEGQTILDPFAGSGTTAVAAKSLGRKCVCVEREERYCEIAAKRCAQDYLQLTESAPLNKPQPQPAQPCLAI